jgi:hypothetical protein
VEELLEEVGEEVVEVLLEVLGEELLEELVEEVLEELVERVALSATRSVLMRRRPTPIHTAMRILGCIGVRVSVVSMHRSECSEYA